MRSTSRCQVPDALPRSCASGCAQRATGCADGGVPEPILDRARSSRVIAFGCRLASFWRPYRPELLARLDRPEAGKPSRHLGEVAPRRLKAPAGSQRPRHSRAVHPPKKAPRAARCAAPDSSAPRCVLPGCAQGFAGAQETSAARGRRQIAFARMPREPARAQARAAGARVAEVRTPLFPSRRQSPKGAVTPGLSSRLGAPRARACSSLALSAREFGSRRGACARISDWRRTLPAGPPRRSRLCP